MRLGRLGQFDDPDAFHLSSSPANLGSYVGCIRKKKTQHVSQYPLAENAFFSALVVSLQGFGRDIVIRPKLRSPCGCDEFLAQDTQMRRMGQLNIYRLKLIIKFQPFMYRYICNRPKGAFGIYRFFSF